jgi:hypothetical protein
MLVWASCGAGHEGRWAASSPHQRRLLRGRLLARFGGSADWARREREGGCEGWAGGPWWVCRTRVSLARWGSPVLPFGPGFLVLGWVRAAEPMERVVFFQKSLRSLRSRIQIIGSNRYAGPNRSTRPDTRVRRGALQIKSNHGACRGCASSAPGFLPHVGASSITRRALRPADAQAS